MLVKFYFVKSKEDLYLDDKYIFESNMEVIPREGELIFTEKTMYRVIDVAHLLDHTKDSNYMCKEINLTVIEE